MRPPTKLNRNKFKIQVDEIIEIMWQTGSYLLVGFLCLNIPPFLPPTPILNSIHIFISSTGSRGIAPTFLKLDSWSLGAGFIPIISTKGINQMKRGKL